MKLRTAWRAAITPPNYNLGCEMKPLIILFMLFWAAYSFSNVEEHTVLKVDTHVDEIGLETQSDSKKFSFVFLLVNDSFVESGDDVGYTHGLKVVGTRMTDYGVRVTLKYSADLYTEFVTEEDADKHESNQFFTDETLVGVFLDNIEQNNFWYWKGGLGWHQLSNDETDNLFYASTHQRVVHRLLNYVNSVKQPNHIEESDRKRHENGVVVDAGIGLQQSYGKGKLSLDLKEELGGRIASIDDASFTYGQISAQVSYQINKKYAVSATVAYQSKQHANGVQASKLVGLGVNTDSWEFGIRAEGYDGDAPNYVLYDTPETADMQLYLYGAYYFGKKNKSNKIPLFLRDV